MFTEIDTLLQKLAKESTYQPSMFFKTDPGSYGAHDQFIGLKVPTLRAVALRYCNISYDDIHLLMIHPVNECRLLGLLILVARYRRADVAGRDAVYHFYMDHLASVNNWNLVDASAPYIVGPHHFEGRVHASVLDELIASPDLWRRRIAIVATWHHIRKHHPDLTLTLVHRVLDDKRDLIHKAAGWMLREVGKRDEGRLRSFLEVHASGMPKTMLRYAVERLADKAVIISAASALNKST